VLCWHLGGAPLSASVSCLGIIVLSIDARSISELVDGLRAIDITVPLRTEGRTTEHCERWSICRFLSTYAGTNLLGYPLKIEKRERPDFLLSLPSRRVGIEITEAVPPDWAWADARREKLNYDKLVFLQRFRPGEPQKSRGEIDALRGAPAVETAGQGTRPKESGPTRCSTLLMTRRRASPNPDTSGSRITGC
jgi:hypothetical protein